MKKSRFSEEKIVGILKQGEAGVATVELCRQYGISNATFYHWKAKYGRLEVSEAQRLKPLYPKCQRRLSFRHGSILLFPIR